MRKHIRKIIINISNSLTACCPIIFVGLLKKFNKVQLSKKQLLLIANAIKAQRPCNLLVFGIGNDSILWYKLNKKGQTIYLEDNKEWLAFVHEKYAKLEIYLVNYETQLAQWQTLLNSPLLLEMKLPDVVENKKWDIILVDAPEGHSNNSPGRMKSIYLASKLIKNGGSVFVHDCNRNAEDAYCTKYLKVSNLRNEIYAERGILRHYLIKHE